MPTTTDQLWEFFGQRDIMLLGLVAVIVALGAIAAHVLGEYEDYFREHPVAKADFERWRTRVTKERQSKVCPQHGLLAFPKACPICGWRPPH